MNKALVSKKVILLTGIFILSRYLFFICGVRMDISALEVYWQYLSVESLQHDLLHSIWYNHTQPPLFNLLLGCILKVSASYYPVIFQLFFWAVGLCNSLLLYRIIDRIIVHQWLPVVAAMFYMLSPATMYFETELFYTTVITFLALTAVSALQSFHSGRQTRHLILFFCALAAISLTRSMYHIVWFMVISAAITVYYREYYLKKTILVASVFMILIAGWYAKNFFIFGKFTSSTWIGMNMARNVFQGISYDDSTRIETIEPFSRISAYNHLISHKNLEKFRGVNDNELLREYKNGSNINEHHIDYIEVSDIYADVSKKHIKEYPVNYLKNVGKSMIVFFAPATRYPFAELQTPKIKWYDVIYSFNLSHFAKGIHQRRVAMVISAFPKLVMYAIVLFTTLMWVYRRRVISSINLFILLHIGFVFAVSSLLEHFENMRFRYELEPLFLVLAAQVVYSIIVKRQISRAPSIA